MTEIFDDKKEGIVLLVETFGGERNYWFYISKEVDYKLKLESIRRNFSTNKIETTLEDDRDWSFISKYPMKLYEKK